MKNHLLPLMLLALVSTPVFGQTPEEVKTITAQYDMAQLKAKEAHYRKIAKAEKEKAQAQAVAKGWPLFVKKEDGNLLELMRLTPDGYPIYYSTENVNAALTTRASFLHSTGSMGLNLNGQGMTARVWDGGNVRSSHFAFEGRVTVVDETSSGTSGHATHVTGTMVASGSPASVKGMAPQALARTFDWNDDVAEAISEAQMGMLVSNHSYGTPITNNGNTLPSWYIGSYTFGANEWDDVAYNAPYYLAVMSAGNDGGNNDNSDPITFGYDKLVGDKTAKNNLVVANCLDVLIGSTGNVIGNITINGSSSQGPTDDLRIKPDITGNGTSVISTSNSSDIGTATLSGTSMSSPNVAGTLILLQQHYRNLTTNFMRAATLKGLACHTADDAGLVGPDAIFGWGLLNAKRAAETLSNNGLTSWVSEENLNNNQTYTTTINSSGTTPLMASITWTDLPGPINSGVNGPNDPTPVLVNDLDIRITRNGITYYPWKLSGPTVPAVRNSDNNVDNVELIKIDNPPAGEYVITVTHKGNLVTGSQRFSLVVTGISSAFSLNSNSADLTVCSTQNATYTFNYAQVGAGTTNFSAVGLPVGATASFSPSSMSANGLVTMTISGLSNVTPGEYYVGIRGSNGSEIETRYKTLRVYSASFQPIAIASPTDGQNGLSTTVNLNWAAQANAISYHVQVSLFNNFSSLIADEYVNTNSYTINGLSQATRYFWRVVPMNNCGSVSINSASFYNFTTGNLFCDVNFTANDYSNAAIAQVANSEAFVPVTVTGDYSIGDLNVNVAINHTWVQDLTITLEGPASIGSPVIMLQQEACGGEDNINCTYDDAGGGPSCIGNPAISGLIAPLDNLSALNNLNANGIWVLRVIDPYNEDGGAITNFSLNICRVQPTVLNVSDNPLQNTILHPNPTSGILTITIPSLNEKTTLTVYDLQGRMVCKQETNQVETTIGLDGIQDGVYLVQIDNSIGSITKKIVLKRN
ncbi:S8 family serine peptidase [Flavobacterium sp.]|uniref:S8 family serine peptidase n=1 Tax=Flavobacterium sp. TaxID=239 RepID=UPI0025E88ED3|nr:S8 family serine peptidase [Flavobacterium sp.]